MIILHGYKDKNQLNKNIGEHIEKFLVKGELFYET